MKHNRYPVMVHFQGGVIKGIPNKGNENIKACEIIMDRHQGGYLFMKLLDRMGEEGNSLQ